MGVVAVWQIHKEVKGKLIQIGYLCEIRISLSLINVKKKIKERPRSDPSVLLLNDVRFNGMNHFLENLRNNLGVTYVKNIINFLVKENNVIMHQNCSIIYYYVMMKIKEICDENACEQVN